MQEQNDVQKVKEGKMFKDLWAKIQVLWGNFKPIILAFVIPSLDNQKTALADFLRKKEGTPEEQAEWIIEQIKGYLLRQL